MPHLPPGTPHNILAMMTPETWASAMNGATLHGPPDNTHVGIINTTFHFTSAFRNHDFTEGISCRIICSQKDANGLYQSLINVPGITEYRDPTTNQMHENIWIPASYIDIKGHSETDINKSKPQLDLATGMSEPEK